MVEEESPCYKLLDLHMKNWNRSFDIMDNMNNDATNELQPNRECVKEEVPEVADEIDNMNKGTVDPTEDPVNNQNDNNGANVDEGDKDGGSLTSLQ